MTLAHAAQAYLDQPATDRLETRLPRLLKAHAEAVARSRGESLSEYVVELLAERVADEIVSTQEWRLTPTEQAELLRVLATRTGLVLKRKVGNHASGWQPWQRLVEGNKIGMVAANNTQGFPVAFGTVGNSG